VGAALAERAEDFPVLFDFVLFDPVRRHGRGRQGRWEVAVLRPVRTGYVEESIATACTM